MHAAAGICRTFDGQFAKKSENQKKISEIVFTEFDF